MIDKYNGHERGQRKLRAFIYELIGNICTKHRGQNLGSFKVKMGTDCAADLMTEEALEKLPNTFNVANPVSKDNMLVMIAYSAEDSMEKSFTIEYSKVWK